MPGLRLFRDPAAARHLRVGIAVGLVTQIVIMVVGASVASALTGGELTFQTTGSPLPGILLPGQPLWLGLIGTVVLAPVSEELFFRGLALQAWMREYGRSFAVIGSAVVFGLVHYGINPIEGLPAELPWLLLPTTAGLVLGILALRTGSLVAPIAAHATMNAVTFGLAIALFDPFG